MSLLPLPAPEAQFIDANGHPYAGGTVETYIPGTDTSRDTYQDEAGTVLNTHPIVLDAAGRCLMYGAGDYRLVLKDADGNLIYDQLTSALDAAGFVTMAQVNTAVQAETDRATAAEGTLTTNLNAEIARAEAAEAHLQTEIDGLSAGGTPILPAGYSMRFGTGSTAGDGTAIVTFSPAFPTACASFVAGLYQNPINLTIRCNSLSLTQAGVVVEDTDNHGGYPSAFYYIAVGH